MFFTSRPVSASQARSVPSAWLAIRWRPCPVYPSVKTAPAGTWIEWISRFELISKILTRLSALPPAARYLPSGEMLTLQE